MLKVIESSGNVFRDLGFKDAEEMLVKARLTSQIAEIIGERGLTQAAAKLPGLKRPGVSNLLRGKLSEFSTERLMNLLILLEGTEGRMKVLAA